MSSRVFSVGREIPGNAAEYVSFRSDNSLFDADVIVFHPTFVDYNSNEMYSGRPLISDTDSPMLIRDCAHWKSEIKAAIESGKVVFIMLIRPDEVYYATGQKTFSGTGRGRVSTRHVALTTSYESIPLRLEGLVPKGGTAISVLGELGPLSVYWNEFSSDSGYEVYFEPKGVEPLFGTKKREKVVGGLVRTKSGGALVLLPPLKWDIAGMTYKRGKSSYWNTEGVSFGKRFVGALLASSEALRRQGKRTPVPEWAVTPDYFLPTEVRLKYEVEKLDQEMLALVEKRKELRCLVEEAAQLRALLYETGKPLETAILKALQLLGFTADPYRDANSEFDVVFSTSEGRFLGEAEGKDNKAINIDKMSQLERNLQEDFAREGVTDFAKGVLFGNAFRLEPISQREHFFTEKCIKAAKRLHVALVRTPDLFVPARYLSEHDDIVYSAACRAAIFQTEGDIVNFPSAP